MGGVTRVRPLAAVLDELRERHGAPACGVVTWVRAGEPIGLALRRFQRAVEKAGILGDLKHHRYAVSLGERRRLKALRALVRREQRAARQGRRA